MNVLITVSYQNFYKVKAPELHTVLLGVEFDALIECCAFINTLNYFERENIHVKQYDYIFKLIEQHPNRTELKNRLKLFLTTNPNKEKIVYLNPQSLEFLINYVLQNQNILGENKNIGKNLFDALLICNGIINGQTIIKQTRQVEENADLDFSWSVMPNQFHYAYRFNHVVMMLKSKILFDVFLANDVLQKCTQQFIQNTGFQNWFSAIHMHSLIIQNARDISKVDFCCKVEIRNEQLQYFAPFIIDIVEFKASKTFDILNKKPIIKINSDYVIIDWNRFVGILFHGNSYQMWMKFTENGIPDNIIRKEIAEEFAERRLLHGIFSFVYDKKHMKVLCPKKTDQRWPDLYLRIGRKVLLVESKDSLFANSVRNSNEPDMIRKNIDERFNSPKKGIGQLHKVIDNLRQYKEIEQDLRSFKNRNLEIYPLIVYTDSNWSLNGVYHYLRNEFRKDNYYSEFKKVHDLVFVGIDFLLENINILGVKGTNIFELIDSINHEKMRRDSKHSKILSTETGLDRLQPAENMVTSLNNEFRFNQDYATNIVSAFELTKNL